MPLHPISPTLILSEGAHEVNAPEIAGAIPIPAAVSAVLLRKSLRDVIFMGIKDFI
jgi:hypothetical protein